jgi:hypothetical protein
MSTRSLDLYHEYADHHMGRTEVTRTYTLTIGEGNAMAKARLTIERDQRSFPDSGDAKSTFEHYEIPVRDLVDLVRKFGRSVTA